MTVRSRPRDPPGWRVASSADLPALYELEVAIFGRDAWSPDSLRAELTAVEGSPDRHSMVCESAGDIVGYAFARTGSGDAEILRVAVAPAHRRRGLATALLTGALDAATEGGCFRAVLEVDAANMAAVACYQALGFTPLHHRRGYYAAGGDALIMAHALASPHGSTELDPQAGRQHLIQ